jgi:hypothetical protein
MRETSIRSIYNDVDCSASFNFIAHIDDEASVRTRGHVHSPYVNKIEARLLHSLVDRIEINMLHWYLLTIVLSNIAVQSSSLSFVNIVPIVHHRMNANRLVFDFVPNTTLPMIHIDHQSNLTQSNCSQDIELLARDLISRKVWALKSKLSLIFISYEFHLS